VGTPGYQAPEVTESDMRYGTKADVWSAGVVLLECLCGFRRNAFSSSCASIWSEQEGMANENDLFDAAFQEGESQCTPSKPKRAGFPMSDPSQLFAAAFEQGESQCNTPTQKASAFSGSAFSPARPSKLFAAAFGEGESQCNTPSSTASKPLAAQEPDAGARGEDEDMLDSIENDPSEACRLARHPMLRKKFPAASELVGQMLQVDQDARPSCDELVHYQALEAYVAPVPQSPIAKKTASKGQPKR